MKVFIATEGSQNTGFGHVTRCTALYQAFEEKGITPVFLINGDESIKDFIRDKNYEKFNWLDEENRLFSCIENADIAIIDSYFADYELYEKVSKLVKLPVYIDDTQRIDYPKGIVINGGIFAEELNYPEKEGVVYLLGSKYAPMRKEFWEVPEKEICDNIEKVMVTLGGDDARNMAPKVLSLLNVNFPGFIKKVIIGKGFKNTKHIEALKDTKTELIYYPDAEGMKRAMLDSDVVISAAGQTLYELARIGVPTVAIAVADNQMNNIKGWQKAEFIEYAGWWENKEALSNIIQKLKLFDDRSLRQEKAKIGRTMVDGNGAERVVSAILNRY
jgi:UDP-2,4-diacetamido-2,4,6-trideoxy-beta-L-altropyranose hydrolase